MNNKKNNEGQSDFSYYGLYLMDYLRTNKFELFFDTGLHSYFGFSGGTRRDTECLFFLFSNRLSR
ncbi:hypothetical protein E7X19_26380 [Bacteroides fragilis]|nr:hypothetical protein E7X19_26380 [Bacteroides fragilis]